MPTVYTNGSVKGSLWALGGGGGLPRTLSRGTARLKTIFIILLRHSPFSLSFTSKCMVKFSRDYMMCDITVNAEAVMRSQLSSII